jgi:hypothetical protein
MYDKPVAFTMPRTLRWTWQYDAIDAWGTLTKVKDKIVFKKGQKIKVDKHCLEIIKNDLLQEEIEKKRESVYQS